MPQSGTWKDYLSAAVRTGGKLVPGVAQAIEVIESVENRRETETRHEHTVLEISRVEKSIVEVIQREMTEVLSRLHTPNLLPRELEEEIANLYTMRHYGREPFMAEGLLFNSQWYEQLKAKPQLYGRVLQDHDKPSADSFYLFIDGEKTRLLEVTPFTLQQLLGSQSKGAPEARVVGQRDVFAERVERSSVVSEATPKKVAPPSSAAGEKSRLGSYLSQASSETEQLTGSHEDPAAMFARAWALDRANTKCVAPDDEQCLHWYRKAAGAGNADAMYNLAFIYQRGRGPEQNNEEAARWYRKAADAGDASAMYALGWMYAEGKGVKCNEGEAVRWYRQAADAGNASATGALGWAYVHGLRGLTKDFEKGIELLRKAFAAGNAWSGERLTELGVALA